MKNKKKTIELLAPAKDKKTAFAAIDCGADAVYIGSPKFGARVNASNSLDDIKDVVEYAHKFRVKVYVTINTIMSDDELREAVELIYQLYDIGVDALIVQDMGLLECKLPPIKLFASTQCHNSTLEKVKFLEKTGFSRVILARELSLDEIRKIADNTDVEIETFIHGALCVSYSGQCYMSYAIGGRSANRGECAQPCRKKYSLVDSDGVVVAKDKHLLCLRDLNFSSDIKDLIDAGVSSFKIEGRLKDEDYIKNVVSFYRKKIDDAIENTEYERSSSGYSVLGFEADVNKTFNRGYCEYFLHGRNKNITSFDSPKSRGEYTGRVKEVFEKYFLFDGSELNNADGICFFDERGELVGTSVNKAEGNKIFPQSMNGIRKGVEVFRNYNHKFSKMLESVKVERKIEASVCFVEKEQCYELSAVDEDGVRVVVEAGKNYDKAKNQELARNNIIKCLKKAGDSCFDIKEARVEVDVYPFIPLSELNELRRRLFAKLEEKRIASYEVEKSGGIFISPYFERELFYDVNIMNEKAKEFYEKRGGICREYAIEKTGNVSGKILMTTKHCLKFSLGLCSKEGKKHRYREPFFLVDSHGKKYKLLFECKSCCMKIQNC